jgi:nuclear pore complex protein Nup62
LGEIITSWNEELENLVSAFERQAVEIAQWDKRIVHNGEQIIALNDRVNKLEGLQKEVDQSLSYVVAQQTELENLLDGIERELPGLVQTVTGGKQSVVDAERDRMYASAETVQKQVIDVANQLSKMIYEINTTASDTAVPEGEMEGQPLVEIAQILNAHLDALQWIDHKVDELKQASVALKGQASKASSEMERFNHSTH